MTSKTYLLDANIFIQAKNLYYRFSTFPSFWNTMVTEHNGDKLYSIDKIRDELLAVNDDLSDWVKDTLPKDFFKSVADESVLNQYQQMVRWVNNLSRLSNAAKSRFSTDADAFLVAYAKAYNFVVVTREESRPDSKNTIKIPDVCKEYDVEYIDTFDLLEELNVEL